MKTYLRILNYVKPYWKHLTFSIVATVLYALLNGASVYLAIPLLDTLFQEAGGSQAIPQTTTDPAAAEVLPGWFSQFMNDLTQTFQNFIFSGSEVESLFKICTLILFAFLGKNMFAYLQAYFLAFVEQGVIKDMRNEAYVHLHKLPMSFFKNEKTGNLISKITNDVNVVQSSVSAVFLNLVREPLTILVFLGIAMSISLHLTLFSFVILPVSIGIIGWIGLKLRKQSGILQSKMADITNILQETISGVKIVKAFGMEDYENRKFKKETYKFFKLSLRMVRVRNAAAPITEFLSVIVGVVIIFYGGQLVLLEESMRASELKN
jgi:subfamily B ATP-binding cassette protein MsbA